MLQDKLGTVRIAPSVLAMIVSLTASAVRGVAGMSSVSRPPNKVLPRPNTGNATGVSLQVRNGAILADVYIVAEPDTNLQKLGQTVQEKVREALNQMVDIPAEQVNVYIEDVSDET
ncbi:MAG TPA: Asp23/Gls24 family envelope stress response protein [Chloroflexia bacterium]|nr:Asp23/Gls24 family envelope stress response protein [Chloroflexia bacterium]